MEPVFVKMLEIATIDAFSSEAAAMSNTYNEDVQSQLKAVFEDCVGVDEPENEKNIVDLIFGIHSSLVYEVFLLKMTTEVKWIFKAPELRKFIFEVANVQLTHIKKK